MANLQTLMDMMSLMARTDAPDFVNNRKDWINRAIKDICFTEKWTATEDEETVTTVSGQASYTTTKRWAFVNGVWLGSKELYPIDTASAPLVGQTSGEPGYYRNTGGASQNTFTFYPTPDGAYNIAIKGHVVVELVNPGDSHALTFFATQAIVARALVDAFLHLGRDPSVWEARFQAEIERLRKADSKRQRLLG